MVPSTLKLAMPKTACRMDFLSRALLFSKSAAGNHHSDSHPLQVNACMGVDGNSALAASGRLSGSPKA